MFGRVHVFDIGQSIGECSSIKFFSTKNGQKRVLKPNKNLLSFLLTLNIFHTFF